METITIEEASQGTEQVERVHSDVALHKFLTEVLDEETLRRLEWVKTRYREELPVVREGSAGLVNAQRINDIRRVNKFFEQVNRSFKNGQYLVITMETKDARKQRLLNKYPKGIN